MRTTEHDTKTPFVTTGFFATLRGLLRVAGSGAPSVTQRARRLTPASLCVLFALALLAPASSFAVFTRPFLRQIAGTPAHHFYVEFPGKFNEAPEGAIGRNGPLGIALDAAGSLWVVDTLYEKNKAARLETRDEAQLDEFEPAEHENAFLQALKIEREPRIFGTEEYPPGAAESLAIDDSTGSLYVGGTGAPINSAYVEVFEKAGAFLKRFGPFAADALVAVDNSTGPSADSVYVASEEERSVRKFNASGEPKSFEGCSKECESYVSGNRITGSPSVPFGGVGGNPKHITVDSHGDIYAVNTEGESNPLEGGVPAVEEYEPSGKFVRSFNGKETPGLGESHHQGGFGGSLQSIAVDPVSGHLLVAIYGEGNKAAIDEFDLATGHFVAQITEASLGHSLHALGEMAVDSKGDVYFVEGAEEHGEHAVDALGAGRFDPSLKLAEATRRRPASALLGGSVDPEGLSLSACNLEYVSEAAFMTEGFAGPGTKIAPCEHPDAAEVPLDSSFHPVHAEIAPLASGTTYRYRLSATTTGALGGSAFTAPDAFTAPAKPRIDSTTAGNFSSTFADLSARIDPLGADTVYHFEYLTEAAYQANGGSFLGPDAPTSVPAAPADIGSGGATGAADASVLQHIAGLQPSTVYRFRVVAGNEIGVTEGEGEAGKEIAHTFATFPQVSPGLPDNRAYEIVTPPDKGGAGDMFTEVRSGGEFFNGHTVGYPSESGDQFLLETPAAFGAFPAAGISAYAFSRTPGGWAYTSLASPSLGVQSVGVPVFDPSDLSRVGVRDQLGSANSLAGSLFASLVGAPGGPYTTLHADQAGVKREEEENTLIVGASHDLGHLVLESLNHTLAAEAEAQDKGTHALYESTGGGECAQKAENCTLVNVNSEGSLLNRCGAVLGLDSQLGVPYEPTGPGGAAPEGDPGKTHNAVSADGSRVLFTAPDPFAKNDGPGCWNGANTNAPQLYMRSGGETIELSAPEEGAPEAGGRYIAQYVGASEDGSRVFFLSEAELTKSDKGIHDLELYEYDVEKPAGERLARVSVGEPGSSAAAAGAGVFAVPAVSAEGSAVYFLAHGRLTAGQPATPGAQVNLYRYDTATAATVYVAAVYEKAWAEPFFPESANYGRGTDPRDPWYTTPDGRYLLYANADDELYRYQAPTAELPKGQLLCVSCNPSGAPAASRASFVRSAPTEDNQAGGPVRGMSNDGSYVFFDSADALVPEATNHTLDVYEWHNGKISLISPGNDPTPSYFLGLSPDGSNVFFGTHAQLVPSVQDSSGNLYDARICTETDPCIKPPVGETAQCEGGTCQNPPAEPIDTTPTSLAFSGPGNLLGVVPSPAPASKKKTIKCSKGKKLSHGKCVKVKPKKKAKKSNRRRGK